MGGQLGFGGGQLGLNGYGWNWAPGGYGIGIGGGTFTQPLYGQFGFQGIGSANPYQHLHYWYEGIPLTDALMTKGTVGERIAEGRGPRRSAITAGPPELDLPPGAGDAENWEMRVPRFLRVDAGVGTVVGGNPDT